MPATSTTNFAGLIVETFSRDKVLAPFERAIAKFHDGTKDWPNEEPLGRGRTFPVRTKDAHSTGAASEATGVVPTLRQPEILQPNIDAVQVVGACGWTELMLSAGQGLGTLGPDVLTDHIEMTTRNMMQCLNRLSLGHGTGRLAVVESTTGAQTTWIARNPESILQLRVNMLGDFFDVDTGGSKQGTSQIINNLDLDTRTVTMDTSQARTAGWGFYQALTSSVSTYGVAPFGLRAWGDNGQLTSTIGGITRSTNPGINANVLSVPSGTQPYSEKLVRKGIHRIYFACGLEPDEGWTNKGVISEHLNHLVGDRIYTIAPGENIPKYRIGYDEMQIGFQHGGNFIPYKCETDLPDRELVLIKKGMFRRHVLRQANWIGDDSGIDGVAKAVLLQLPASGGSYELAKVAIQLAMVNYGNRMPKSICSIRTIKDEELAGDV